MIISATKIASFFLPGVPGGPFHFNFLSYSYALFYAVAKV